MDRELSRVRLGFQDRSLIQEICYGTLRWRDTLDWIIDRNTRVRPPDPPARIVLRVGIYQLLFLDRVPPHAALNETVEAARQLELGPQTGFINAVLRNCARAAESLRAEIEQLKKSNPALGWSHPAWLVDRWSQVLSPAELQALLAWNNTPAVTYARVNTLKADPAELIESWRNDNVEYDFTRWDWTPENLVFLLRRHPALEKLKSFRDGWFYVQDPSTLMSVSMLQPRPGERILDFCSAPGGKATYIAQLLDNDGRVIAFEPDDRRRARLRQNCERLGADVEPVAPGQLTGRDPFDAALVDAPCSNTGVLRRRLDARWRLRPADIQRSRQLQLRLLVQAIDSVRPGGRVVYSTCSLEPEENQQVVSEVLASRPDVTMVRERLLHPARDGVDGAYAALLIRQSHRPGGAPAGT